MNFENILVEKNPEGYAVLTMNRLQVLNAFNRQTFAEINGALDTLLADGSVRGLIITGAGRAFAAGADLGEIHEDGMEENRQYSRCAQDTFSRIEELPIPSIAAVNGFALGGGCELAMACDIRIAGEKAKFGMPEVSLGVIPCFGGTQRLPALVGVSMAKELIFTGKKISAQEAKEIGLVTRVVEQEELMHEAVQLMTQMLKNSSTAIKYAKLAIDHSRTASAKGGMEFERDLSAICYGLPDKAEGMAAFLEKRPPVFPSKEASIQ